MPKQATRKSTADEMDIGEDDVASVNIEGREDPAWFFYNCDHQAANTPCPEGCHMTPQRRQPEAMPDNWHETYTPPGPEGALSDAVEVE